MYTGRAINFALYYAGWFACVLGPAWGYPWTGTAIRGAMLDLWFPTLAEAQAWGRRSVTISFG